MNSTWIPPAGRGATLEAAPHPLTAKNSPIAARSSSRARTLRSGRVWRPAHGLLFRRERVGANGTRALGKVGWRIDRRPHMLAIGLHHHPQPISCILYSDP